jgi:hypothetical protein
MNFREPPQATMGARKAIRCLTLLLLSSLLPKSMLGGLTVRIVIGGPSGTGESSPYLSVPGCPPLRFREPEPPADFASHPAAAAPPQPHLTQAELSVGTANAAAAQTTPQMAAHDASAVENKADGAPPASSAPISILPDTVRPQVQAEDFLPFFVIPESARSASSVPVPPEPGKLPPSSATYTEK